MARPAVGLQTPADGARAALPVALGYLPIGFAAGVVGAAAGMSPAEVALLSLLLFAGSGQFVFADLLGGGGGGLVGTIFLLNFRHFLYSTALARRLRRLGAAKRVAIGAQLTDETFAMASALCPQQQTRAAGLLTLNMLAYCAWFVGNVAGALTASQNAAANWGADFLLVAMFAALLMVNICGGKGGGESGGGEGKEEGEGVAVVVSVAVAGVAAAGMVGLELFAAHPLNILLAAGVAAGVGAFLAGARARQQ